MIFANTGNPLRNTHRNKQVTASIGLIMHSLTIHYLHDGEILCAYGLLHCNFTDICYQK